MLLLCGILGKINRMKIVLLGYMGSGKTTVGKMLAEKLGYPFKDLDDFIEDKLLKSIAQVFQDDGEVFFRHKEHELLIDLLKSHKDLVLALGGGTPCYSGNMNLVVDHTPNVFFLKMGIPELVERLKDGKEQRPLIKDVPDEELSEFIGKHLFERNPYYNMSHHVIQADKLSAEEVVEEILKKLV